MRKRRKTTFI